MTTTIRLDERLKARLRKVAEREGKTAHAFILDAIAGSVAQAEEADAFDKLADERWARLLTSGKSVAWEDAKEWLQRRAAGRRTRKPVARKPSR